MNFEQSRAGRRCVLVALCVAAVSVCFRPTAAQAQPAFNISIGRNLASMSGSPTTNRDQVTAATVQAEQRLAAERLRLFYDFEGSAFDGGLGWGYYLQSAGTTYKAALGTGSKAALFVSAIGTWQTNVGSWPAPDYRAISGRANVEWRLRPTATVRAGYLLNRRTFADAAEMNHLEQDGFASLLLNLPTRTTLVGETHFGRKSYAQVAAADPVMATTTTQQTTSHGWGKGGGDSRAVANPIGVTGSSGSSHQLTWLARVAQSLTDRTGAWVQITGRTTFGPLPPPVIGTPALYFDDGVYDDPFASDALALALNGKHHFAGGMTLEAQASTARKHYNSTIALDLDGVTLAGDPLRRDRITRAGAAWTLPIVPHKTGPVGLDLTAAYAFVRQQSNDVFYTYSSHALGLRVSLVY